MKNQPEMMVLAPEAPGPYPRPEPFREPRETAVSSPVEAEHAGSGLTERPRIVPVRPVGPPADGIPGPRRTSSAEGDLLEAGQRGEFDEWNGRPRRVLPVRLSAISPLLAPADGLYYAAEQYRIVRTKVAQLLTKPFRLVITSPGISDGKTVTAVNLATAMALRSGERTLLIDADLRRAGVHRLLQAPLEPGLTNVLAGTCQLEEAMFTIEELPGFYALPAGRPHGNPTELLDSSRWRALAETVRRHFAQVIVDCPPVEVVADFDLVAAVCDGVALVVRPDHTDRTLCLAAIAKLRPKLVGVLINAAPEWFLWKKSVQHEYYYRQASEGGRRAKPVKP
jgi:capsular exopolysaccharide synthesis family protein